VPPVAANANCTKTAYWCIANKVPAAGNLTEGILPVTYGGEKPESEETVETTEPPKPLESPSSVVAAPAKEFGRRMEDYFTGTRGGRIASYSGVIAWKLVLLIFFSFFHEYIAWYHSKTVGDTTTWTRLPLLTNDYYAWLPILVTALILSIAGHIILIIYDRYWLREIVKIILNLIGIAVVLTLLSIFPFNFGVIPNPTVANAMPITVTILLIAIAVGLAIASLVTFIKLIVNVASGYKHKRELPV